MKFRFQIIYRLGLVLLLVAAFWSVWANAAERSGTTNSVVGLGGVKVNEIPAANFSFGLDGVQSLQEIYCGEPLWKYLASLIYILLAFCVAWLMDFIVGVWLHRLATRTKTNYDDLLLRLLRGPVKVVAFVILLNIGLGLFDWPPRAQLLLSRGLIVVVAFSVTYLVVNLVELLLRLSREKIVSAQDRIFAELLFPLLSKLAKVGVVIAAVILTADNLDIKITSLLAGLSVGGLALGLAAQDTVANLFGAVAIFLDKPFYLGDTIRVEGIEGSVESIGLRSTRLRNADGYFVMIPNKTMGNATITNITRRPSIRTEMNLALNYDTPVDKVKRATAILEEIYRRHPKTGDLLISFNKFGESALNIYIAHIWKGVDGNEQLLQMQQWNLEIKQRFEAEGIQFAFPTRSLLVKTEAATGAVK
jgi:MscS family membrane protein